MKIKRLVPLVAVFMLILPLAACAKKGTPAGTTVVNPGKNGGAEATTAAREETAYQVSYSVAKTYKDSIGSVWVQYIIEITNTGKSDLYLSEGACDLEDATGKLVASETLISVYPQVISSGEKAYYYGETILEGMTEAAALTVKARPAVEKATVKKQELAVSDVEIQENEITGIKALGRVENTTGAEATMTYVAVVLFDAQDKPIGLLYTILTETLAAGDKIGFEAAGFALPDEVTKSAIASQKAVAFNYQYQF